MSVDYHLPRRQRSALPPPAMPVPTMIEPALDHHKRFQAAVDVIQKLPKNGLYRPSYGVMLRFYSLYKQAVCGPCTLPRPGFWDPVGRYKWDAWSRLGSMSSDGAMVAYVDEMKKVAQEVLETLPVNEKTASLIHHFEPLYLVVEDMPSPPQALLDLRQGVNGSGQVKRPGEMKMSEDEGEDEGHEIAGGPDALSLETGPRAPATLEQPMNDSGLSEGLAPTSDSESEIFCDSLDSEEQLVRLKIKSNGLQNGYSGPDSGSPQPRRHETVAGATQVGSGQGGEGAGEDGGPPMRRRRNHGGRDGPDQNWRERSGPPRDPRTPGPGAPNMGGGGAGGGPEGGAERLHDAQLQQQIVVALRRLREDMRSVMERLEAVERLAAAHAQNEDWRLCSQCATTAASSEGEKWWPFEMSGQTLLLLLLWPLVAQGLLVLLRRAQKRGCVSS